jgi:hypothetical protein
MIKEEGSPAWTASGSPQSARTTYQANTPRASAHRLTLSDLAGMAVVSLGLAAILIGLCALVWLVA